MKKKISQIKYFFLIVFPVFLYSQDADFQNWCNLEFNYKPIKKIEIGFTSSARYTNDHSLLSRYFFDFNIRRKHNQFISYSVGYRRIYDRSIRPLETDKKHRLYCDAYYKNKINKRIKYSLRFRLQGQTDSDFSFNQNVKNKFRQKIKFIYDLKDSNLDFYSSLETFLFVYESNKNIDQVFEKIRYQIGIVKPLIKNLDLNVSFLIQQNIDESSVFYVVRPKLTYSF